MNVEIRKHAKKKSLFQRIISRFLKWFRLTNHPALRLYTGFGNKSHCFLYGHVFSFSPLPRKRYRRNFLINAFSLLRLFMVKIKPGALLEFTWDDVVYHARSEKDGFFKFEWQPQVMPKAGHHKVQVNLLASDEQTILATAKAILIIPHYNQFAFISDIDDTFLISHSGNLRKRLFVLLTENAMSRKPFDGVVNHYQLLASAHAPEDTSNPFFYVSSSEWNLYNYIRDFSAKHNLPEGVYLLNQVKTFSQVFKTGQNNHGTKFMRIARVLEAYPEHRFILLGDDSQEDPFIYASVVEHFKQRIVCIYIRKVSRSPKPGIREKLSGVEKYGVKYCYFNHSAEAVAHSREVGLIDQA